MADIIYQSIFADNLALSFFLGMCTFLAVSNRVSTALGLGVAIIVVLSITVPLNNLVFDYLLAKDALRWLDIRDTDLSFLKLVAFIAIIASMVQILELTIERFSPALFRSLGVFLPLLTVNCAILGASLFMVERRYTLSESMAYGFGSGIGWALAIALFAAIRERINPQRVPAGLRGLGLAFIVTGIISIAFSAFSTVA